MPFFPPSTHTSSSVLRASVPSESPLIIAHRGASGLAPENTCLSVVTAMEIGADMVEVDVQLSRDGCPVIFHDRHLGRLARSTGYSRRALKTLGIGDLDVKDIKRLNVGSWKGPQFAGLPIPTLAELLAQCAGEITLNLEIKVPDPAGGRLRSNMIDQLAEALILYPAQDAVLISAFDRKLLELARTAFPSGRLGVLPQPGGPLETLRLAERLHAFSVHLRCREVRPSIVKSVRASGVRLFAYTADKTSTLRRLIAAGVDGIFTNFPDRMLALLRCDFLD